MPESAVSRRAEQRVETAARLTALARKLTAERGFAGFRVEELCDEVGVSRRTFFNYFPSKEDAVFGVDESEEMRRLTAEFLARGSRGWPAVIDDLIELAARQARDAGFSAKGHADFFRALEREPKLLARLIGLTRERELQLSAVVAEREGVEADDPHVRATILVVGTTLRSASERFHSQHGGDFGAALQDSLAAIRAVTATPQAHEADQKDPT